ncbi:MAG: NAD-dependent deacylase [Gammaproteobacteria bacterium]|nr:NAD-dependent deacylase [Gammaproteobacteria bacterium]MDH5650692.1 NAD-dependent deacylase [Gammaproteobacteria bacterium]
MSRPIDHNKIVILTGAGVSAESGLQTFRDSDGLWNNYNVADVATPQAWQRNPQLVLDFYNHRRSEAAKAQPNAAHLAIAELEKNFDVTVITQNVDDLHERAGSSNVIHIHGELNKVRSTLDPELIYNIGDKPIKPGDTCDKGAQLRPHIVWFGEIPEHMDTASQHLKTAGKVLVIGTSLAVYPAAGLLKKARHHAEKIIVALDIERKPYGYTWLRGKAGDIVPHIVNCWLEGRRP